MEKYYIWLLLAFGEGEPEISRLIKQFGTAKKAYEAVDSNIAMLGAELRAKADAADLAKAGKLLANITGSGISVITWESANYPVHLRGTVNPPCVLFAQGNVRLLDKKLVTIVGSRAVTAHTASMIPKIIDGIAGEYVAVSTLSEGCDQLVCLNALKAGVPFIEILPCGFSHTYPTGSSTLRRFVLANGGLLLTEFLPKTKAGQGSFLRRSRVIGGISYASVVLQAGAGSGALATAEYSSTPLFLPPFDIFAPEYAGAVTAVRNGASLYLGIRSIEQAFDRIFDREHQPDMFSNAQIITDDSELPKADYRAASKKVSRNVKKAGKSRTSDPVQTKSAPRKPENAPIKEKKESAAPDQTGTAALTRSDFETEDLFRLYSLIAGTDHPAGIEELISASGHTADELAEMLLDLEIMGAVKSAGNRYIIS